ncbi:hypothetical protein HYW55_04305 [Candidatus Gottesmanbacteria bacterium]|nr:hypothetical protein [Candidatus Gottesmanbacteria bacterium]
MDSLPISPDEIAPSPWAFFPQLREGEIHELNDQRIPDDTLTAQYEWGTMKRVFFAPATFLGRDAALKVYRDPSKEDQALDFSKEDIPIIIHPNGLATEEPPIGTVELSQFKREAYLRAKKNFGDRVPPTSFFLARDHKNILRNWEAQVWIHGDIISQYAGIIPFLEHGANSFGTIIQAAETMLEETGYLPDFQGNVLDNRNIICTEEGDCFLVDTDGQLQIDPDLFSKIKRAGEKIVTAGKLHPEIITWMEKSDSDQAFRCKQLLQTTVNSIQEAKQYLVKALETPQLNEAARDQLFVQHLEIMPMSVFDKVNVLLVYKGLRTATTTELSFFEYDETYDETMGEPDSRTMTLRQAEKLETFFKEFSLPYERQKLYEDEENLDLFHIDFLIGKDAKSLAQMKKADGMNVFDPHLDEEYGIALGFPETAARAHSRGQTIPLDELPPEIAQSEVHHFAQFDMSRDHWKEEFKIKQLWADTVKRLAPKIYQNLLSLEPLPEK